ncbi:MAG: RlmE family RNA methyltransferase [Pseudomonadota bacterium]
MERRKTSGKPPKRPKKTRRGGIETTALGRVPEKRGRQDKETAKGESTPRDLNVHVKTAKHRAYSSTLWLKRQLNDPYVARAKAEGWRSRAAFKLIELDEKFAILKPGDIVADLGCAPGGWTQVAVKAVGTRGRVIGIDYLNTAPIAGAEILELDFLDASAAARLRDSIGGPANVVLSDMAAPTTGHRSTDHLRIIALAEVALDFAMEVLSPGGVFVAKVFSGGAEGELLEKLKANFELVKHAKPKASRAQSSEKYVVAKGFKGRLS